MEHRFSQRLAALTSAASATEQRRHLQEIVDFLSVDSFFASLDLRAPGLWGELAVALLSAARQQFSRAFPTFSVGRTGKNRKKPIALVPNDAIAIQKIFNAIETRSASSGSCSPASNSFSSTSHSFASRVEDDWSGESEPRSGREASRCETKDRAERGWGRGGEAETCRGEEDDFLSSFSSSSSPLNSIRSDGGRWPEREREKQGRSACSCGARLTPVAADVIKQVLLLLLACANKRREVGNNGECLRPNSLRLLLLQRACQSERKRKREGERAGGDRGAPADRGRSLEDEEDEWKAADEKWEGCFLSILQQLLRNENYLRVLPSQLVRASLSPSLASSSLPFSVSASSSSSASFLSASALSCDGSEDGRGAEAWRGMAQAPSDAEDCDRLGPLKGALEADRTPLSAFPPGASRHVSFIQLGRAQTAQSQAQSTASQRKWEAADAWRPGLLEREDGREKTSAESECGENPGVEDAHFRDAWEELGEPLVVNILLGLLQDDTWVHLEEATRWNVMLLVRWTLILARGTTGREILPSLVGASGKTANRDKHASRSTARSAMRVWRRLLPVDERRAPSCQSFCRYVSVMDARVSLIDLPGSWHSE
uniref:Uncharacterized protein n=1 Tax=Neospora caninum (strain Liverpool) TaxID=572307 RepID=F0JAX4_NEOCL|nr:hypothetical protein, conserved [Neospora caninum Liverpool]CEL71240.1 TPA: hypothetical protein, conserved [Neospora caninum Liverpool]